MSRAPHVEPGSACTCLALIDYAIARSPEAPLAFLRGWLTRAATEHVEPQARRAVAETEAALRSSLPPNGQ